MKQRVLGRLDRRTDREGEEDLSTMNRLVGLFGVSVR